MFGFVAAAAAATGGTNKSNYLCGVNSTEVMTDSGWESMSHLEKRHPLFAIYQDGKDNKSFLQVSLWLTRPILSFNGGFNLV